MKTGDLAWVITYSQLRPLPLSPRPARVTLATAGPGVWDNEPVFVLDVVEPSNNVSLHDDAWIRWVKVLGPRGVGFINEVFLRLTEQNTEDWT